MNEEEQKFVDIVIEAERLMAEAIDRNGEMIYALRDLAMQLAKINLNNRG